MLTFRRPALACALAAAIPAGRSSGSSESTAETADPGSGVAGLQGSGATGPVGIYSTASQWQTITGLNASSSQTYFASQPDWVAGASSLSQAQSQCSASFTGGRVALAQYPAGSFDGDYPCP